MAKPVERYYFLLPTPIAHTGHPVPEVEGSPPLAQTVSDEIINQLSRGITETAQLRDHIASFVEATFGPDAALHQDDPSYYPSEHDIFRHVYWLYKTGQVVDQESAFKQSLSLDQKPFLPGLAAAATAAVSSPSASSLTPPRSVSSEAITSVYSIIMGESDGGGTATLELGDNQMQTGQEVEINPDGSSKPEDEVAQTGFTQVSTPVVVAAATASPVATAVASGVHSRKPYTRSAAATLASSSPAKPAAAAPSVSWSPPSSLCLSVSPSLSFSSPLSLFLPLSLSLPPSPSLSPSLPLFLLLSLSLSLSLFLTLPLPPSLPPSLFFLSLSLSFSLSLPFLVVPLIVGIPMV